MENDAFWTKHTNSLAGLNEFLLPVNVACAAAYAACLYVARGFIFETPRNDSGYYFLKGVVRVGDLLHHFVSNPLVRNAVGRRDSALWHPGLIVLTVLATIWSAALIIQLLIRIFFSRLRLPRLIRHMSGAAALFSAPISCVGAWFITSNWGDNYNDAAQASFGHNVLLSILGTELLIFFILSVPRRRLTLSRWARAIMLLLHFAFWSFVLFPSFIFYIRRISCSNTSSRDNMVDSLRCCGLLGLPMASIIRGVRPSTSGRQMVGDHCIFRNCDFASYLVTWPATAFVFSQQFADDSDRTLARTMLRQLPGLCAHDSWER